MSAPVVEGVAARGSTDQPVVVVGAGPAGLVAAERLLDAGVPVVVVDSATGVGAGPGSVELWGHRFDLGPQGLRSDAHPESVTRWLDLAGAVGGVERTRAVTSAVWRGRVVALPPGPGQALRAAGAGRGARMAGGRLAARFSGPVQPPADAYEVLVAAHGRGAVDELLVPHARKHLGVHPRELPAVAAAELQGLRGGGNGPVDLLTPREGTGAVWDELARRLRARGARILLGTRVVGLSTRERHVTAVQLRDSAAEFSLPARAVVSALPAADALGWLPGTSVPAGAVPRRRDTHLVHLLVEGPVGQHAHQVTACDESLRVGRLTNTRTWRPVAFRDEPRTVLRAEFWSSGDDDVSARPEHELAQLAIAELPAFGVDPRARVLDHDVLRLPRSVPVPTRGDAAARAAVDEQLDRFANLAQVGPRPQDGQDDLLAGRGALAPVLAPAT